VIYIGAEHILSSLGNTASENFNEVLKGNSGITHQDEQVFTSKKPNGLLKSFKIIKGYTKVESMCIKSALECLDGINKAAFSEKWLLVLSTTKGDIEYLAQGDIEKAKPSYLAKRLSEKLPISCETMIVSSACISGLLATITAHDLLLTQKYTHALVVGVDIVSAFTTSGFESFYALSEQSSKPFDKDRTGLSLGEAVSSLVLSSNENIFDEKPVVFSGGASSNDANHISGPSRTGEGLYRAVQSALKIAKVDSKEVDFISAHGTGTKYNDDMESIAFTRSNLNEVPLNSMKGYFGHTLGAAGTLELAMSIQSMRNGIMLKTHGCTNPGTSESINILLENKEKELNIILKTASGFGGCNAAAILRKT
jgi:3-oxoacyl-[acyl-carrier-protein] synthase-1